IRIVRLPSVTAARTGRSALLPLLRGRGSLAGQVRGAENLGPTPELLGGAGVANAPALEHIRGVREREGQMRELLDQEHPRARRGHRLDRRHEALDDDRREPERELVYEQHARTGDERLREHEHLLLAARQQTALRRPALLELREQAERIVDPVLALL